MRSNTAVLGVPAAIVLLFAAGAPAKRSAPKKFGPEYVGSETCQACHEDLYNEIMASPHKVADHACESCHGPGADHAGSADATKIKNPLKLPAQQTDRICLACHLNQTTHDGRIQSSHMKDSVACTTCHTIHGKGPVGLVPRRQEDVNALCGSCHSSIVAQFQKPFRHKVPENAMTCVDCHNPHGSSRLAMGQSFGANEPGCLNCHGDKRGPFTVEHPPMRYEGCTACHEPHGSANPRLLIRADVRQLCLECHANLPGVTKNPTAGAVPPAFHDLNSPRFRNCTVCHQKIHGSYIDRDFLK
ncbi:MAG: DmsE family decaheme c-type cytochrome [Acidobacteriota bacterium]|nr:DmsE family decaheme c-type cytochrome [Acidobacteriota bacterium]